MVPMYSVMIAMEHACTGLLALQRLHFMCIFLALALVLR